MTKSKMGKCLAIDVSDEWLGCPHCGAQDLSTRLFRSAHAAQYECLRCDGEYVVVLDGGSSAPPGFGDSASPFRQLQKQPHPYRPAEES